MFDNRTDYCNALKQILNPLKNHYSQGKANLCCGVTGVSYGEKTAEMEAFARPLWGLAPLWCGDNACEDFADIYLEGIICGTDPNHKEYWGKINPADQKIVETAPLGLALAFAPHKIWEPLNDTQKNNLFNWLWQVNEVNSIDNNWQFFAVLVNLGLKAVGQKFSQEKIDEAVSKYHSYYIGNGWYSDGKSLQMDYYISFAMHFYTLIYAKLCEKTDPINSKLFKERAEIFAKDFIYWFDEDGSALAFGRSLTYRFAQCAFWSACVFAGIEPFSMGVMKGIISRHLEYWLNLPIFDNGGILSIGYGYPNICMSESYNASGSPYWALKSFLILALDKNHKFFSANPLPLPELDKLHIIKEAKMVIQRINGKVFALTSGQWAGFEPTHTPEKYSKFLYSSRYAFSIPRSYFKIQNAGADNMLVFEDDDKMCYVRRKCISHSIADDGSILSEWSPCYGINVQTVLTPTDYGHIRTHTITADRNWTVYDCSVSISGDDMGIVSGAGGEVIEINSVNTNILMPNTKMAAVKYTIYKGTTTIKTEIVYPDTYQKED